MKRLLIGVLAASSLATALPASAAAWESVNHRQAKIYRQIEQGVHNGALTRNEAYKLRSSFLRIARLERTYRATGHRLTNWERRDLDRRLHALNLRVHNQRHDNQRRW